MSEQSVLPTGTVTLMFTDIEGSTRLAQKHGERYHELLADHHARVRGAVASNGGIEVKSLGDGFFFAFAAAKDGVEAAAQIQASLAAVPLRVRIGIHTGEPRCEAGDYQGLDVHRVARICAAGHGGQVLLSERTRSLLASPPELTPLGRHRLKGLGEPEKLYQLGSAEFPALRSLSATNLPAEPSPLVGRRDEIAAVRALLERHRLVTLTGPGGTGKTRLALHVAAELAGSFEDGVMWVPLAAVADADLVLPTVAQALGAEGELAEHIDERRMLLLVDNLEQVSDCGPALAELLAACPNLVLLATSRTMLNLYAEREYAVPPLPDDESLALFCERAYDAEPQDAAAEICRRLDGLPLAIELAAARTRIYAPDVLLAQLEEALPVLTAGPRDAPERQRTLEATVRWSYELLTEGRRRSFARLGCFAGSFGLEGAHAVCDADIDDLESLIAQSLLRRSPGGRFAMLATIREFALDRLTESPDHEDVRRRHGEHLLGVALAANVTMEAEGEMRHDLVIRERDDIRAALDWAVDHAAERGLELAVSLENYWATSAPHEGAQRLDALLERGADVPTPLRARALRVRGGQRILSGDDDGRRDYEESLALYRALGDDRGAGMLLARLALLARDDGDLVLARAHADEALPLLERAAFTKGHAQVLTALAEIERASGNLERACELQERSIGLAADCGFSWWQATALGDLAEWLLERGMLGEAAAREREAIRLLEAIGDRQNLILGLAFLARLAGESGDAERAGRLWGAVEAEESRGRVGRWEGERDAQAALVLAHASPEFEVARGEGRGMDFGDAVRYASEDALDMGQ